MSAIRTLIEAHKTAMRATTYADNEEDMDRLATFAARALDVLVAEPAKSMDAVQAKARYLRDSPDIISAIGGSPDLLCALLDSFIHVDPVVYAIENHRRFISAREAAFGGYGAPVASADEQAAWDRLLTIVPQTLDGVQRLASHVASHPDLDKMRPSEGLPRALANIAGALQRLGGAA